MSDLFRDASAGQTARRKHSNVFAQSFALKLNAANLKNGLRLLMVALALSVVTTSCVRDDDEVQCGDANNPCIVVDEMGDG